MKLSKYIDHTNLKQDASNNDIKKLCEEAINYDFMSVCINPSFVSLAKSLLEKSNVLVCTVVGFPLGQNTIDTKVFETKQAIEDGADEIDMVINITKLKANDVKYCVNEINEIKEITGDKILKVIVETCLLNSKEIIRAMEIVNESNADFIKTSTGFSLSGANIEDITT
jgi:deoxyribose-phosphate aldolase